MLRMKTKLSPKKLGILFESHTLEYQPSMHCPRGTKMLQTPRADWYSLCHHRKSLSINRQTYQTICFDNTIIHPWYRPSSPNYWGYTSLWNMHPCKHWCRSHLQLNPTFKSAFLHPQGAIPNKPSWSLIQWLHIDVIVLHTKPQYFSVWWSLFPPGTGSSCGHLLCPWIC